MTLCELQRKCESCRLCSVGGQRVDGHLCNVFSNMNAAAKLMVVGQNPGHDEVLRGEPFVGASGQFFEQALKQRTGLTRADLYIGNVVRCFTPGNRKPYASELDACRTFLDEEIAIVQPRLVVALGSPALRQLTGLPAITKHRGVPTVSLRYRVVVIGTYHPSPFNMDNEDIRAQFMADLEVIGDAWRVISERGVESFVEEHLPQG